MRIFTQFLALCVTFILVFKVQAAPAGDRLQAMTAAIQPSFSQGLVHLSSLFDLVMNYDETVNNDYKADDIMSTIQGAIRSASSSLNGTETITIHHVQMYEANLLSLATDISEKQAQLRQGNTVLEQLTKEGTTWEVESKKLRQEIADLKQKQHDADKVAKENLARVTPKYTYRFLWIVATIITLGLAAPGLVANEKSTHELEYNYHRWQLETKERLLFLQEAKNELESIADRQRAIEESVGNTRRSLESAQKKMEQLRKEHSVLGRLGDRIRKISTFLVPLNGEMGVVRSKHQMMVLFSPLLKSVDSLVSFLEKNANMVVLLGESEAVSKIHQHFSQNVMLTWGK